MSFMIGHGLSDSILKKKCPSIAKTKAHYYCPDCVTLIQFGAAQHTQQLTNLLSRPIFNDLRRNPDNEQNLSDVTSDSVYKTLREKRMISNLDISIQWNADGLQTLKSSKVSVSNTKELKDLHENGFQCFPPNSKDTVTIKIHTILAPVDSVERCALQNTHQYNGRNGCSFCLNPGEHYTRDAIRAEKEETVINEVKGVSTVILLPFFHVIKSFPPEYMHSVLHGVIRKITTNHSTLEQKYKLLMLDYLKYYHHPKYYGCHNQYQI
ncbi:hypothetical protein TSAR_006705 [Trichomalopsis sarcophagae]|uniref:Uncharacterized protein n=1 Tax=Trichomalopsis sarcophagae TaxID=543379 RepID=A0A232EJC7_9HYME|nr:hypothetical protein TSAR_006705 [Trichomalopsis sarcophagae]